MSLTFVFESNEVTTMTGKINRMITVEIDVWEKFQRLFPKQASSFCTEQMRLRVAYSQGDISGVNVELLKIEEREALAEYDESSSKLREIQDKLKTIEHQTQEEEKVKLQEEQTKLEAQSKCAGCRLQMDKPYLKVGVEQFCKDCFMGDHPKVFEAIKRDKIK